MSNSRLAALDVLLDVLDNGRSLNSALPPVQTQLEANDAALCQELCYGVLRWRPLIDAVIQKLIAKPLQRHNLDIQLIIALGIYQLGWLDIPPYASVSATVSLTRLSKKGWATGLVNGVLRNFQRDLETLCSSLEGAEACYAHPQWLIDAIRSDWPEEWRAILEANNQHPPLTLRVNRRYHSRDGYLGLLHRRAIQAEATPHAPGGITLMQPLRVTQLPGFDEGHVTIQDGAAQQAAPLLAAASGMRVLDACAAPGGKTGHILEQCDDLDLVAVDNDAERLQRVTETLERLGGKATLVVADAADTASWWDGRDFDRILLDAPCTASGVIRRHPDIKSLRRMEDLAILPMRQERLLNALWPLLRPGGRLVYATCSIFRRENCDQVEKFVERHEDAHEVAITADWGEASGYGRQIRAGQDGMDGFYYACIDKA